MSTADSHATSPANAALELLFDGARWTGGLVWFGGANCLLFSDIPNNLIMRRIDGLGVSIYRQPSQFAMALLAAMPADRYLACTVRAPLLAPNTMAESRYWPRGSKAGG